MWTSLQQNDLEYAPFEELDMGAKGIAQSLKIV